jgi:predicted CopG family antitoxin
MLLNQFFFLYILEIKLSKKLKHITVSEKNYLTLKELGKAGDSFNDVVTEVLKNKKVLQFDPEVAACDQTTTATIAPNQSVTKGGQSNVE